MIEIKRLIELAAQDTAMIAKEQAWERGRLARSKRRQARIVNR